MICDYHTVSHYPQPLQQTNYDQCNIKDENRSQVFCNKSQVNSQTKQMILSSNKTWNELIACLHLFQQTQYVQVNKQNINRKSTPHFTFYGVIKNISDCSLNTPFVAYMPFDMHLCKNKL